MSKVFVYEFFQCTLVILFEVLRSVYNFFIQFIYPSYKSIQNEKVLVTGAGSGIGRLLCKKLVNKGCIVVGVDIDSEALLETKRIINNNNNIFIYTCDIRFKANIIELRKYVECNVGHIDILINNAGIVHGKSLLDLSESEIKETFDVNTFSNFYAIQEFLPSMLTRSHGHIVFVASIAGCVTSPRLSDYCASKAATIMLSETLLAELRFYHKNNDINVTTVLPYFVKTGMFTGCSSKIKWLFVDLETDYVATKIVEAIMKNQILLCIGRLMYFIMVLKSIMPVSSIHGLYKFSGGDEYLKSFNNIRLRRRLNNYK